MVFLTNTCFARAQRYVTGSNRFWKVQQFLRFTWHFRNRKRNNYGLGFRYMQKSLRYSTMWRQLKKIQQKKLFNERIEAATMEHNLSRSDFLEGLARSHVQLDRKVLTDLAIYEPRTFKSLVDVSKHRLKEEGIEAPEPIFPTVDFEYKRNLRGWQKYYKTHK